MHGRIVHVAINADDLPVTRGFYETVFGWSFEEYMPGFIRAHDVGVDVAAIQGRRALLNVPTNAPEVTIEVDDVDAAVATAVRAGGAVAMEKATIPGVGELAFMTDPSGNLIGAIRFSGPRA
jgi:predicted enzyme related to lactoylglutathione lyase